MAQTDQVEAGVAVLEPRPPLAPAATAGYARAYGALTGWAAGAFAVILGFARLSYGLLLPALRADLHGSYSLFGLIGSANLGGYLLGTLAVPALLSRFRDRARLNMLALLAMSLTMLGSATSADLAQLAAWRLLVGLFSALATVLTIGLTLERVAPVERGRASGLLWMGGAAGIVLSGLLAPLVTGSGESASWRWVWAGMGLSGVLATWGLRRALRAAPAPAAVAGGASGRLTLVAGLALLLRPRGLLTFTLAYFAFGCGYIIYATFFIALVVQQGVPALLVGLVWSAIGAAGIAGGVLWGRAADRWPVGFTLAAVLGVGAVGALAVGGLAWDALGAVLTGSAFIGTPAIGTALLRRAVPGPSYTAALSLWTAIFALGQVIGPLLGGLVIDRSGLAAGTALAAPILAVGALLAVGYGAVQRHGAR